MKPIRRVAVDLTPVLPGGANGGAKVFVLELLRQLARLQPGCEFLLLTQAASHHELATLEQRNMRRVPVDAQASPLPLGRRLLLRLARPMPGPAAAALRRRLEQAVERRAGQAVIADLDVDLLFCPFTAPLFHHAAVPTVCTIYDLQYKTYPQFFAPEDVAHRHRSFTEAVRRASGLAAISEYSRQSAIDHGGMPSERIVAIPLRMARRVADVDPKRQAALLDRLGLAREQFFLYPANFWRHKNHEMLLTAFAMACASGLPPAVRLVLTGATDERQRYVLEAAARLGLGGRVVYPGFLDEGEFAALMGSCTAVVFPSLYEGFGLPVLEAMAAGRPVACSNLTSLPEVAQDAALLFDPRVPAQIAEALLSLQADAALRARLIETGRQRVQEFMDPAPMAQAYWALFESAVANARHETLLQGRYADGWAGPELSLHCTAVADRRLRLELDMPAWHPLPQVKVAISAARGSLASEDLQRGQSRLIELPLPADGSVLAIRIAPTFRPSADGKSADQRDLGVLVKCAQIVGADGRTEDLLVT